MSAITKVAVSGANGELGRAILNGLLEAGFQVTALVRTGGKQSFPASVTTKAVDYESVTSLTAALEGQDAVVSTLGFPQVALQYKLVEAAVSAGVRRFIPSEFGSDTTNPLVAGLAVFKDKLGVQQALRKASADTGGRITYSIICTGPFLDWGLTHGLYFAGNEKSLTLWDGGDARFSVSTLPTIGKAVAGVLKRPNETANRAVYVQDAVLSQKQFKGLIEKATGEAWEGPVKSTEDEILRPFRAELKKENPDLIPHLVPVVLASVWIDGAGGLFEKLDNELLGVREFTQAELEAVVTTAFEEINKKGTILHH